MNAKEQPAMRLVGNLALAPCPTCRGTGRTRLPNTYAGNGDRTHSSGAAPCPRCRGSKVIATPAPQP